VADEPIDLRTDVPHSGRIYDYLLGGTENFPVDRAAGEAALQAVPDLADAARANRRFMCRVTRHLVRTEGVRQFLDIGSGLPTSPNMHEVAQEIAPETRVVYVDNDPIVLVHGRSALTSAPEGRTAYLEADLREPEAILSSPEVRDTLDLSRPVALSLIAVLHFIVDDRMVKDLVGRLMEPLAKGSVVMMSAACTDPGPGKAAAIVAVAQAQGIPVKARSMAEVMAIFEGLEPVPPGLVLVHQWRPDEATSDTPNESFGLCGGVWRKT
jgi:hypothetical protein